MAEQVAGSAATATNWPKHRAGHWIPPFTEVGCGDQQQLDLWRGSGHIEFGFVVSEFSVDLDDLDRIVARLSGLAGFASDHLDDIDGKVAALTGTGWESVAAQAYSEAHQQWMTGVRQFAGGARDERRGPQSAHAVQHVRRRQQADAAITLAARQFQG
ncbi:WXG100 family type VII secretion target [Nocardia sp. CA-135953]|uniref:WXG100 family type VII secretion target n=1 Tax=Nocardia sp. CA-135953 TaxID=3239978 RepID=UPI003D997FFE